MLRALFLSLLLTLAASAETVEESARSILASNCLPCHGETKTGGLDVRDIGALLRGGTSGPAVVPGKSSSSLLYRAVERTGDLKMPPGKQGLSPRDVKVLGDWIDAGARWPTETRTAAAEPSWWSFRKPIRPAIPSVRNAALVRTPIDNFILAKLAAKGLQPSPQASKVTLIRRVTFDLTGLPPRPQEVEAFLKDDSPNAWEKLVDRLLASPQYGERWGRQWLDVVRYADSSGFEGDNYYPNAWRYRDYVIKSFNDDKPYDQFVKEQIAGDEIWPNTVEFEGSYVLPKQKQIDLEHRTGTGMYAIGPLDPTSALNGEQLRYERLTDMADTTSAAFLGLTMGCARCHDHKFDPITQKDYYRLQAIFAGSEPRELSINVRKWQEYQKGQTKLLALEDLQRESQQFDQRVRTRLKAEGKQTETKKGDRGDLSALYTDAERAEHDRLVHAIVDAALKLPPRYPAVTVLGHTELTPEVRVAVRGDFHNKASVVKPGFPAILSGGAEIPEISGQPLARRKALALWITNPDHPLTARVMVNRIWQGHFQRGIVGTPNDFGRQGDAPTHPELLDWLATEFVKNGWSIKRLHRTILLSSTYQRSDEVIPENAKVDPDNRLLWRMNRRRLEAEGVRDAILASAGTLNLTVGGPPVIPPLSDEEIGGLDDATQWPATHDKAAALKRSVYLYVKRGFRVPMLETFDMPDSSFSAAHREATNVAPQALALMNNTFVFQQAKAFATRVAKEGKDPAARASAAWRIGLGREPSAAELQRAEAMLTRAGLDGDKALLDFCLMLFNLNEFLYID